MTAWKELSPRLIFPTWLCHTTGELQTVSLYPEYLWLSILQQNYPEFQQARYWSTLFHPNCELGTDRSVLHSGDAFSKLQWPRFNPGLEYGEEFARFPCDHILWALGFPPTTQRHASIWAKWPCTLPLVCRTMVDSEGTDEHLMASIEMVGWMALFHALQSAYHAWPYQWLPFTSPQSALNACSQASLKTLCRHPATAQRPLCLRQLETFAFEMYFSLV